LAHEPQGVRIEDRATTFVYGLDAYAWLPRRRQLIEFRFRGHFIDARAWSEFGTPTGRWWLPMGGDPTWN